MDRPWDCVSSFREFIVTEESAPYYAEREELRLYQQVARKMGARALLLHEQDNLTIWPDQGGFIRLKPDGTWEMDLAPFSS